MALTGKLKRILFSIPFLGRLTFDQILPWKKAFAETGFSVILGSISIWVGGIALSLWQTDTGFIRAISNIVKNGEFFILSATTVSPLFYIALIKYRPVDDHKRYLTVFPHGMIYVISAIVILGIGIVYITLRSIFGIADSPLSDNLENYVGSSWLIYGISVFLFFTASVHKHAIEDSTFSSMRDEEDEFAADFSGGP